MANNSFWVSSDAAPSAKKTNKQKKTTANNKKHKIECNHGKKKLAYFIVT